MRIQVLNTKHATDVAARAIVCGMLLVLPSCAIPPHRPPELPPDLPASFNRVTSPESSARTGAAEFFNDPLLIGLIDQALAGNRELKILNEEVVVARSEVLAR